MRDQLAAERCVPAHMKSLALSYEVSLSAATPLRCEWFFSALRGALDAERKTAGAPRNCNRKNRTRAWAATLLAWTPACVHSRARTARTKTRSLAALHAAAGNPHASEDLEHNAGGGAGGRARHPARMRCPRRHRNPAAGADCRAAPRESPRQLCIAGEARTSPDAIQSLPEGSRVGQLAACCSESGADDPQCPASAVDQTVCAPAPP